MTNIKIVRRLSKEADEQEVYDIYFDVGLFIKKWEISMSALTREEVIEYIKPWLLDIAGNKIYVVVE